MAIKFGTDGWRAIISDQFTFANLRIVAQALADYLIGSGTSNKGIAIGYDTRFLADKFAVETAKVMLSNGIPCTVMETDTPTPVVAFTVKDRKLAGAVMITASHNPPQYCGFKFISSDGGPAPSEITRQIEANIAKVAEPKTGSGHNIERINPFNRYMQHIKTLIDLDAIKKAHLKVAYDPLWGTGRNYLGRILEQAGCQVRTIHENSDVLFGGITPEPIGENLDELKAIVRKDRLDIGLSTDPDADRFGVVDEKGDYVSANHVLSILLEYLITMRGEKGCAVRSIATTHMMDSIAEKNGIKMKETPVGFKYIAEIMLKEAVIIGGEESGGLSISDHVPEKDGILAGLLICEMVARKGKPLSQILADDMSKYGSFVNKRVNMHLSRQDKESLMKKLKADPPKMIAGSRLKNVSMTDGVKMIFEGGGWLLARPSGTEDLVRTYFEAKDDKMVNGMIKDFEKYVSTDIKLNKGVGHGR